eukprot:3455611-Rhodomonas_salina.2
MMGMGPARVLQLSAPSPPSESRSRLLTESGSESPPRLRLQGFSGFPSPSQAPWQRHSFRNASHCQTDSGSELQVQRLVLEH